MEDGYQERLRKQLDALDRAAEEDRRRERALERIRRFFSVNGKYLDNNERNRAKRMRRK